MGIESKEVKTLLNEDDPVETLFGQIRDRFKTELPYPPETVFRVFVGCLNDIPSRMEYEALLTKSFHCQNNLENPGDLALLTIQGSFDKEGCYHVVARYAIIPEKK